MAAFLLVSTAFAHGEPIPPRHTCQGEDLSPTLAWSGVPEETRSLVLIADDPDAPDPAAPKRVFVHWVVYDLPPSCTGLPEGVAAAHLPGGGTHGVTDFGRLGYGGPCPPIGRHRYFFKLYALDRTLDFPPGKTRAEVEAAMAGHVLQATALMGTYAKS